MTVFDAHAHAGDKDEIALRKLRGIRTALSCGNPEEAQTALALCESSPVFSMTAGVHPWDSGSVRLGDMLPYMEKAALAGEIGLDSVWCNTPMAAQRKVFIAQLDWAASKGKGIVLHTKGCESEIARMICGFPYPVIVHWYSSTDQDPLDHFLAQGCYFTVGPDIAANPAVQAVARLAPDDRILFETDGMAALRWALGSIATAHLPQVLEESLRFAARLRNQSTQTLLKYANGNFQRLF